MDEQFEELVAAMGCAGDTHVKYAAFLKIYGKGSKFDRQVT